MASNIDSIASEDHGTVAHRYLEEAYPELPRRIQDIHFYEGRFVAAVSAPIAFFISESLVENRSNFRCNGDSGRVASLYCDCWAFNWDIGIGGSIGLVHRDIAILDQLERLHLTNVTAFPPEFLHLKKLQTIHIENHPTGAVSWADAGFFPLDLETFQNLKELCLHDHLTMDPSKLLCSLPTSLRVIKVYRRMRSCNVRSLDSTNWKRRPGWIELLLQGDEHNQVSWRFRTSLTELHLINLALDDDDFIELLYRGICPSETSLFPSLKYLNLFKNNFVSLDSCSTARIKYRCSTSIITRTAARLIRVNLRGSYGDIERSGIRRLMANFPELAPITDHDDFHLQHDDGRQLLQLQMHAWTGSHFLDPTQHASLPRTLWPFILERAANPNLWFDFTMEENAFIRQLHLDDPTKYTTEPTMTTPSPSEDARRDAAKWAASGVYTMLCRLPALAARCSDAKENDATSPRPRRRELLPRKAKHRRLKYE